MNHSLKIKNKKNTETGDSRHIYKNELNKVCYQQNMTYENFKDLNSRTAADKVLCDKTFHIAKNKKYYGCQQGHASVVFNFFSIKKLQVVLLKKKLCKMKN